MSISLEKITRSSLTAYFNELGALEREKYDIAGVSVDGTGHEDILKKFVEKVPAEAELVLDFRLSYKSRWEASGIALIPKESGRSFQKIVIPLEKILTTSLMTYFDGVGVLMRKRYNFIGIHESCTNNEDITEKFCKKVPDETDLIVDFQFATDGKIWYASGTALIPKKSEK